MKNIHHINKISILCLIGISTLFSSCKNEEGHDSFDKGYGNTLYATLSGSIQSSTRALYDDRDNWSVNGYTNNDVVGLYAKTGNLDGDGSFVNSPMYFSRAVSSTFQFENADLNMDRSQFSANNTILYYPFDPDMEEKGMNLRQTKPGEDLERCPDFLFMKNLDDDNLKKQQVLSGRFNHVFSELIIVRGEGFDQAENKEIFIVTNTPCTRLRLIENPNPSGNSEVRNVWKIPDLYYDADDNLTEEESRRWKAWKGADFEIKENDLREAFYVMIPNVYSYRYSLNGSNVNVSNVAIDYIELYDDGGILQRISNFTLEESSKQLKNGVRYPVEIKMDGLVPTVYPYKILPWGDTQDITVERETGITQSNYTTWVKTYYDYTNDPNPADKYDETLLNFGDKKIKESDGSVTWTFYILENIDFKNGGNEMRISKLKDVLDGMGNQLSNLNLTDSFIGEISGNGSLTNLSIKGLTVKSDKEGQNVGIGALTNRLTDNGSIIKCEVDATLSANCSVGIMAGEVTGGRVEKSNFSGLLIGKGSSDNPYRYLIGRTPEGNNFEIKDTNYSGIIYMAK